MGEYHLRCSGIGYFLRCAVLDLERKGGKNNASNDATASIERHSKIFCLSCRSWVQIEMNSGVGTLHLFALIAGVACCMAVFVDAFQTIILPRRATGKFRITRFFFILTWTPWTAIGGRMKDPRSRFLRCAAE
jgi:hypothetical protein